MSIVGNDNIGAVDALVDHLPGVNLVQNAGEIDRNMQLAAQVQVTSHDMLSQRLTWDVFKQESRIVHAQSLANALDTGQSGSDRVLMVEFCAERRCR